MTRADQTGTDQIRGATPEGDRHRAKANAAERRREESWQRSDTDGFITQWAAGITAQVERRAADIADAGGVAPFMALVDANGERVPFTTADTRYGFRYLVFDTAQDANEYGGQVRQWLTLDQIASGRKGVYFWPVMRPAKAVTRGSGTGLSGTAWAATVPADGMRYNPDAPLVPPAERDAVELGNAGDVIPLAFRAAYGADTLRDPWEGGRR